METDNPGDNEKEEEVQHNQTCRLVIITNLNKSQFRPVELISWSDPSSGADTALNRQYSKFAYQLQY